MTAPTVLPQDQRRSESVDDDLDHLYCCDPNRSMCGLDLTDVPEVDDLPNLCVVCDDLDSHVCPCPCGCCPAGAA